jgi:hypothetical protein
MNSEILSVIITDALWVVVIGGWILLIVTGLERDKPLSGGIPGHLDGHGEQKDSYTWTLMVKWGRGWCLASLLLRCPFSSTGSLPFIRSSRGRGRRSAGNKALCCRRQFARNACSGYTHRSELNRNDLKTDAEDSRCSCK